MPQLSPRPRPGAGQPVAGGPESRCLWSWTGPLRPRSGGLAPAFAVACLEEAEALREGGITAPIVLLEGVFSAEELAKVDAQGLWMAVHSDWQVEALLRHRLEKPVPTWIKVDSGMHRLGFSPERAISVWARLSAAPTQACDLHLMSHFATADHADTEYFQRQMSALRALAEKLGAPTCLANSPATLARPESHGAWNRPASCSMAAILSRPPTRRAVGCHR